MVTAARRGRHEIKEATLYATYRRLLKDGLIEAYWGDESQGGRRKYYRITDAGRAVYRRNMAAWARPPAVALTGLSRRPACAAGPGAGRG